MNTKKDRIKFVESTKQILNDNQAELTEFNSLWLMYKIEGSKNSVTIKLEPEQEHQFLYSVFCRLEKPSQKIGNKFSGKHNFHSMSQTGFKNHLKKIIKEIN